MAKARRTFCWNCWRDWKTEFLDLSPWEQEQYLNQHPRINPNEFERGKCPLCGAHYDDELNDLFDEIFLDDEAWLEPDYGYADWEED